MADRTTQVNGKLQYPDIYGTVPGIAEGDTIDVSYIVKDSDGNVKVEGQLDRAIIDQVDTAPNEVLCLFGRVKFIKETVKETD